MAKAVDHDHCGTCGVALTPENIVANPAKRGWRCRDCDGKKHKAWRGGNKGRIRTYARRGACELRWQTFMAYGGPRCACCGERTVEFLSLDHIDGGGTKQRRIDGLVGLALYRALRKKGWPKGYRVLCHNCNQSLGYYGYCPHADGSWGDGYVEGSVPPDPFVNGISKNLATAI